MGGLFALALIVALSGCGGGRQEAATTAAGPSDRGTSLAGPSMTEIRASLDALSKAKDAACAEVWSGAEQDAAAPSDDWSDPSAEELAAVESFDCTVAFVESDLLFGPDDRSPIPATAEDGSLVGYWLPEVGMLPLGIVDDPAFDSAAWQQAGIERSEALLALVEGG